MSDEQPKCPVDHKTREAWISKAKQASVSNPSVNAAITESNQINSQSQSQSQSGWKSTISSLFWAPKVSQSKPESIRLVNSQIPEGHPVIPGVAAGAACPVDHKAREKWLGSVKSTAPTPVTMTTTAAPLAIEECSSDKLDKPQYQDDIISNVELPEDREISSIPRTGSDSNWIYPSQKQFFNAMKRKEWNPNADDMQAIVPIHNQVNEQAWRYILMWEQGQGAAACGGLQLSSFKGDSTKITPRARIRNLLFGHDLPFDRHDWVVDRCGTTIDYVIDFYSVIPSENDPNGPKFFLDVRPKLNSLEGWKLRVKRALGI